MTATNSAGTGAASSASNAVTPASPQTITFANPSAQNFGTTPTLTATASSGLTVTFSSSTTGVCTITSSGLLTTISAGTCTVNADQAGNGTYLAATQVSRSFTINPIVPGAPGAVVATAGDTQASVAFSAPASSGGASVTGYTVMVTPPDVSPVSGASSPIVVTGLTNGQAYTFTVTADNAAGTGPASAASSSITPKAVQTITFANPGVQDFGTTPTLGATSDSGLPVTFTSSTTGVCTITSSGGLTFVSTGTCTINADQAGDASYLPATQVSRSFAVSGVLPGAPTGVSALAGSSMATVSFTVPADTGGSSILDYTVTASPGGATAAGTSSPIVVGGLINGVSYTFTVTARNSSGTGTTSAVSAPVVPGTAQTITFANPGPQVLGTSVTLSASATSGLSVHLASTTLAICTVTAGGTLTPVSTGTCTIEASQAGDSTYLPAAPVQQSFVIGSTAVTVVPASGALPDAMAGEGYSAQFIASGQSGTVLWSISTGTLPAGMVLNASTGELTGPIDAGAEGAFSFTVAATDQAGGGSGSANMTLKVLTRAVAAENKEVTVPPGATPPPINLVENATGGPFTAAAVAGVEPAIGGTAEIIMGLVSAIETDYPGSFYLQFTPNPQYSGTVVVTYTLTSALGTSDPATVTIHTSVDTVAVEDLFSDLSRGFITARGNLLAGAIETPGLRERRGQAGASAPGTINAIPGGNSVTMSFASSSLQIAAFEAMDGLVADAVDTGGVNFWIDGTATLHVRGGNDSDYWGSFSLLSAGADVLVNQDLLVGVVNHADWMEDSSSSSSVTGQGFLVGPYVSAELVDGVFLDASVLYGRSWNDASTQIFQGRFDTERLIGQVRLEGTWDFGDGLSFRPFAKLFYLREEMESYVVDDGAGNTALVPGFLSEQLKLSGGGSLHFVLETENDLIVRPYLGLQLGLTVDDEQVGQSAALSGGVDLTGLGSWTLGLLTQADFASEGFRSISARARFGLSF